MKKDKWQRHVAHKGLKYLLAGHLQKKFADPCFQVPWAEIMLLSSEWKLAQDLYSRFQLGFVRSASLYVSKRQDL